MIFQAVQSIALNVQGNAQLVTPSQLKIRARLPLRLLSETQGFQKSF